MMQSGQRLLQRTQAIRQKAEAEMRPEAMERAGWWFRDVSVLAPEPDQPAVPDPVAATPATPPASAARAEPAFETLIEAEQYALIYPRRAALIRDHGGLPSRLDFGPPEPEIVEALVRGSSSILRALDQQPRRPFAAAA